MESPRWKIITPSKFEWERRGLDFIRQGLPDHDPYRAWSNFEFQAGDGAIYEVDLLVLTKQGFWLGCPVCAHFVHYTSRRNRVPPQRGFRVEVQ
jgi:hypothetical protein